MRPPNKSRSRNKNNRRNNNNNSGGNVLNRVYDSAGPDGRVRGTPVQVIEKYQALAHDNSLAGDRVAMENFQQHAEHYIRMINEAQRQIAERREQIESQNRNSGQDANNNNGRSSQANQNTKSAPDGVRSDPSQTEQPDVMGVAPAKPELMPKMPGPSSALDAAPAIDSPSDGGLVETPEGGKPKAKAKADKPKRVRRPKDVTPKGDGGEAQPAE